MQAEDLKMYESWELDVPVMPKRSHLYSLKPVGRGTSGVESLTSYMARLAQTHGISVATLIRYKLTPLLVLHSQSQRLSKEDATRSAFSIWYKDPMMLQEGTAECWLDGTQRVEKVVEVLEELTLQQNLRYLTMLPWSRLVSLKHAFRSEQLWCPACYQDWRESEYILYEPLLWAFEVIKVCPRHQRYLQTWCLYCHSLQPFLKLQVRPGYCSECRAWLGRWVEPGSHSQANGKELDWNFWAAEAVGQLLAATPLLNETQTSLSNQPTRHRRKLRLTAFLKQCYKLRVSPIDRLNLLSYASLNLLN